MRLPTAAAAAALLLGLAAPAGAKTDVPIPASTAASPAAPAVFSCYGAPFADACIGPVRVKVTQGQDALRTTSVIVYVGDERVGAVQLDTEHRQVHIGRGTRTGGFYLDMDLELSDRPATAGGPSLDARIGLYMATTHDLIVQFDGWIWSP